MATSRRAFISSGLACLAVPYLRTFADQARPRVRIGVLSDIHVRGRDWTLEPFVNALQWYAREQVDGVVIAGDLVDFGLVEQLKIVGEAWQTFFPGNRAKDGRPVEKLFVTGNHDHHFYNHNWVKKRFPDEKKRFDLSMAKDFNAAWMAAFGEPYLPVSTKTVNGYAFVLRNYGERGLAAHMKAMRQEAGKPFFFVQHLHPQGTCYGPESDGVADKGDTKDVLSTFPNCVAFTGHTHYPLTDPDILWRREFTVLGAGSLQYVCLRGWEGAAAVDHRRHQGLLMDVYDDRISLRRCDVLPQAVTSLGDDIIIRI